MSGGREQSQGDVCGEGDVSPGCRTHGQLGGQGARRERSRVLGDRSVEEQEGLRAEFLRSRGAWGAGEAEGQGAEEQGCLDSSRG